MKAQIDSSTKLISTQLAVCEKMTADLDITIREFLVYQNAQSSGEFGGTSVSYLYNGCFKDLAEESSEHLLNRMMLHFHHVCMRAREVHVQQNFTGYDVDDSRVNDAIPINVNAITRVVFNEFSFYPYRHRGPLAIDELLAFCEMLEAAAKEYPMNMHMCISSLPVYDHHGDVFNVAIYLQCGRDPRMNVFAKAVPDEVDPLYEDTENACYAFRKPDKYIARIKAASSDLIHKLTGSDLNAIRLAVDELLETIASSPDYLLDKYNQIDANVEIIKKSCATIIDNIVDRRTFKKFHSTYLCIDMNRAVLEFTRTVERAADKNYETFKSSAKAMPMPQANLAYRKQFGLVIYRGGLVECVTAGGVEFVTVVDICFDNCFDIATRLYQRYLENCLRDNKLITPYLSHIVTSNTINIETLDQPCDVVVQCDVNFTSVRYKGRGYNELMPAHQEKIDETAFGSDTTIAAYHPYVVAKLAHKLRGRVEYYNKMIHERRALARRIQGTPNSADLRQLGELDARASVHLMQPKMTIKTVLGLLLPEIKQKLDDEEHPFSASDCIDAINRMRKVNEIALGNTLLQWSIINDIDAVFDVVVTHPNVNLHVTNAHGYTAFALAVMYNRIEMANKLYAMLITTHKETITLSLLSSAPKLMKAALLTAAIKAQRVLDVKYLLNIGADLFLMNNMNNYVKPVDSLSKSYTEALFTVIYDHVKLSNQLSLFSTVMLYSASEKAKVFLVALCCRDQLDQDVDFIFKMQPSLLTTTNEIEQLNQLIDLNDGSEVSQIVNRHLNELEHQQDDLDELVEIKQVNYVTP